MNAIVRTFRAPDPRAALDAVKAAFGEEAVILETREVGGGFWRKPEIEVTAASGPPDNDVAKEEPNSLESEVAALRQVVEDLRRQLRNSAREEPRERPEAAMPPDAVKLHRRLLQRGVESEMAEDLIRLAVRTANGIREPDLLEALRELLRQRLGYTRPPWEGEGRRVIALCGPTGVGKTTTIAKIAARALLDTRLRVAFITIDTYRIGGSEHIGRYGEIMGVPTHVARDAAGLREALARTADAQLVLIDTAGRSDASAIAAQVQLLRSAPEIEIHLVLSAASGAREIRAAARRHQAFGAKRLIFSKIDEADGPGCVLSAVAAAPAPVSCLADGQRVPEDLHPATGDRLIDLVLGR